MLKLKVKDELMNVEEYLDQFKKHPEVVSELKQSNRELSDESVSVIQLTLYLNTLSLNQHLHLEIDWDENQVPFFQFSHRMGDRLLGTRKLNVEDTDQIVTHLWLQEVQWFVCAGLSSFFSDQWLTPQEVEMKLDAHIKEVTESSIEPTIKDRLILQMGNETFPLSELINARSSLKKIQFNQLLEICYHQFVKRFYTASMKNLVLGASKDEQMFRVFESDYVIYMDDPEDVLPVIFSLALQGEVATENNDGECAARWCWGIYYQGTTTYLPIGSRMELAYFTVKDFQKAIEDMLKGLSQLLNWLELLALETKSGLTLSSNLAFNEYQAFLENYSSLWTIEAGQLHFSYQPKPNSQEISANWTGQPTLQQYEQWMQPCPL